MTCVRSAVILAAVLCTAGLCPRPAQAWGPAVHIREADAALDRLLASQPEWAALVAAHPNGRAWLRLGALSPDFQWLTEALPFGHGKPLSYHLLDAAPADRPDLRLFALGHLAHNTSDAVSETFFGPHAWASHPIGYLDLLTGVHDDGQGEVEFVCEALGDLTLADWAPVVDLLFDFYLDGDAARAQGEAALQWYCATGVEFTGQPLDCDAVTDAVMARLGQADDLLGGLSRPAAKRVISALLDQPLDRLVTVALDGPLASVFGGQTGSPSPTFEWELADLMAGPVLTDGFWALYEADFATLSAQWVEAHLAHRAPGFPAWDPNALVAANWLSTLRFDERFAPHLGIIPDAVSWTVDGAPAGALPSGAESAEVTVQFFAAVPYAGTVRAVVRVDRAPLSATADPPLADARVDVAIDPTTYGATERSRITVPFPPDLGRWPDAQGVTVTLHHGDDPRPFFTTDADDIWAVPAMARVPRHRDVTRAVFRTYGVPFPGSLPVADAPPWGRVHVVSRLEGVDVPLPHVGVRWENTRASTGPNGLGRFVLPAGPATLEVGGVPHAVEVRAGGVTWLDTRWPAETRASAPACSPPCIPLTLAVDRLRPDAVIGWWATPVDAAGDAQGDALPIGDDGVVCLGSPEAPVADGQAVHLAIEARFGRHGALAPVTVGPVTVDGSPPTWAPERVVEPVPCGPAPAVLRAASTWTLSPVDPHCQLRAVRTRWRIDGAPWTAWQWRDRIDEPLAFPSGPGDLWIEAEATNRAVLVSAWQGTLAPAPVPACGGADAAVVDAGVPDAMIPSEATTQRSDGCRATPGGAPTPWVLLLLAAGGAGRRRRRPRAQGAGASRGARLRRGGPTR